MGGRLELTKSSLGPEAFLKDFTAMEITLPAAAALETEIVGGRLAGG